MEEMKPYKSIPEIETDVSTTTKYLSNVIVYNDDWHTFDEVIFQLNKATNCSFEKARAQAFEIHVKGSCAVFQGNMKTCLKVSSILEEIALNTQIVT